MLKSVLKVDAHADYQKSAESFNAGPSEPRRVYHGYKSEIRLLGHHSADAKKYPLSPFPFDANLFSFSTFLM